MDLLKTVVSTFHKSLMKEKIIERARQVTVSKKVQTNFEFHLMVNTHLTVFLHFISIVI